MKLKYLIILCLVILCIIGGCLFFFSRNDFAGDNTGEVEVKDSETIEVNIVNRGQDSIEELYIVKDVSEKEEENLLGDGVTLDENSACAVVIDGYDSDSTWISYAVVNGKIVNADRELTSAELYDGATLDIIYDGENITYISVDSDDENAIEEPSDEIETGEEVETDEEIETGEEVGTEEVEAQGENETEDVLVN